MQRRAVIIVISIIGIAVSVAGILVLVGGDADQFHQTRRISVKNETVTQNINMTTGTATPTSLTTKRLLETDANGTDEHISTTLISGFIKHRECKDYDEIAPYYTRTFIAGYTYPDEQPISDTCIEGITDNVLLEFSCDEGEIRTEEYACPYGCSLGACMVEDQARSYARQSSTSTWLTWRDEDGTQYALVNAYLGSFIAPWGTVRHDGTQVPVGEVVNGALLTLSVQTGERSTCVQQPLERVIDENGNRVPSNTPTLQLIYDGGCTVPPHTQTYLNIVFLLDDVTVPQLFIAPKTGSVVSVHQNRLGETIIDPPTNKG